MYLITKDGLVVFRSLRLFKNKEKSGSSGYISINSVKNEVN